MTNGNEALLKISQPSCGQLVKMLITLEPQYFDQCLLFYIYDRLQYIK